MKIETSYMKSDVWQLLPSIYIIDDYLVFAVGFQWLVFSFEIAYHKTEI
jgi:hypothetical protein